jgi:hypothetical protein
MAESLSRDIRSFSTCGRRRRGRKSAPEELATGKALRQSTAAEDRSTPDFTFDWPVYWVHNNRA